MPDPVLLSRLQFFWVISFHILLPAFTVGLACYIAVLESLYLKTGDHAYFRVSVFWTKIFAVSFGLGVVSGIVMPFQFGTNWSRFSDAAANVIGPLMAYEGLTATRSSMAGSMRRTGSPSSSIRPFRSGFHTLLQPFW